MVLIGAVLRLFGLGGRRNGDEEQLTSLDPAARHPTTPPAKHKRPRSTARRAVPQPVIDDAVDGSGGVQGLGWVARGEAADEDGDVADGFIDADAAGGPVAVAARGASGGGGGGGKGGPAAAGHKKKKGR